jgi:starch synthase
VIRDLPLALSEHGNPITVLIPAYGVFADEPGATRLASVEVPFGGTTETAALFELPAVTGNPRQLVLDHPRLAPREPGAIYCDDEADAPFATDAGKFAFFCAATAAALTSRALPRPYVVHVHDWPGALFFLLREFDSRYAGLKKIPSVFTIHNLALQGVRPLTGHPSSLEAWFPELRYDRDIVTDPRWSDCINPMAVAIRLADKVSTVSPTYAREILVSAAPARGFGGGEGLEADLRAVAADGRLVGILNGCAYPENVPGTRDWASLLDAMRREAARWLARDATQPDRQLAERRLAALTAEPPGVLLTSVGRIGSQKTRLFREPVAGGKSALAAILDLMGKDGLFVMIGSGEQEYEDFLTTTAEAHSNFVFLRGYSDEIANGLYAAGDLFLMPSSFEPCGISQMLAMRAGQPCVVHGVGGLRDTVKDRETGFVFAGDDPPAQAAHFTETVAAALALRADDPAAWQQLAGAAAAERFSWARSAAQYSAELYELAGA